MITLTVYIIDTLRFSKNISLGSSIIALWLLCATELFTFIMFAMSVKFEHYKKTEVYSQKKKIDKRPRQIQKLF